MSTTPDQDPTIGKLVADASRDISALVQHEIALAKSELKVSVRAGGTGIALVVIALFLLLMVAILGSFAVVYFIVLAGLAPAWAYLIVTVAYLLLAVLAGLLSYGRFKKIKAPEKTIETAKEIPQTFTGGGHRVSGPAGPNAS